MTGLGHVSAWILTLLSDLSTGQCAGCNLHYPTDVPTLIWHLSGSMIYRLTQRRRVWG